MAVVGADKTFNLTQINDWIVQEESLLGPMTAIGDGGDCTAVTLDATKNALTAKFARLYLKIGGATVVTAGKVLVCEGQAYLSGTLMDVYATRDA